MFGNLGELAKIASKAKEIKEGIQRMKDELPRQEFHAMSASGKVHRVVSGDFTVKSVEMQPEATADEVAETTNRALLLAKEYSQKRMQEITGGMGIDLPMI